MEEALAWPRSARELIAVQAALAEAAWATRPWALPETAPLIAGCCVAYATGEAGPGHPGDRAWAAAVVWRPVEPAVVARSADSVLRRRGGEGGSRQAADVVAQGVVGGRVAAPYTPGLLALREGPILATPWAPSTSAPTCCSWTPPGSTTRAALGWRSISDGSPTSRRSA